MISNSSSVLFPQLGRAKNLWDVISSTKLYFFEALSSAMNKRIDTLFSSRIVFNWTLDEVRMFFNSLFSVSLNDSTMLCNLFMGCCRDWLYVNPNTRSVMRVVLVVRKWDFYVHIWIFQQIFSNKIDVQCIVLIHHSVANTFGQF